MIHNVYLSVAVRTIIQADLSVRLAGGTGFIFKPVLTGFGVEKPV